MPIHYLFDCKRFECARFYHLTFNCNLLVHLRSPFACTALSFLVIILRQFPPCHAWARRGCSPQQAYQPRTKSSPSTTWPFSSFTTAFPCRRQHLRNQVLRHFAFPFKLVLLLSARATVHPHFSSLRLAVLVRLLPLPMKLESSWRNCSLFGR